MWKEGGKEKLVRKGKFMIHFKLENRFVLEKKSKQNVLAVFFKQKGH